MKIFTAEEKVKIILDIMMALALSNDWKILTTANALSVEMKLDADKLPLVAEN